MSDACPLPRRDDDVVQLAHGGGGRRSAELIDGVFRPAFGLEDVAHRHDGALLAAGPGRLALTTDSYVVKPLVFPGGDIGRLAVLGTVNDLAMCGARPLHLAAAFVLEEGLEMAMLRRVARSMGEAAREAGVTIATGDTKVVERGRGDGVYVTTTGIGLCRDGLPAIGPGAVRPGDAVLLSGDIGRHGMAVLAAREELGIEGLPDSDCAPLDAAVAALLDAGVAVRCLRDLTRGGLASALVEIAEAAGLDIRGDERAIAVAPPVRAACELLGLDPLHVACEGRFVAMIAAADTAAALDALRRHAPDATAIGRVAAGRGRVEMTSLIGGRRRIDMAAGEQLPRIC